MTKCAQPIKIRLNTALFFTAFFLGLLTVNHLQAAIVFRASSKASARNGNSSILYVGRGQTDHQDSGNVKPELPQNYAIDDLIVCLVESRDNVTPVISSPSGWTNLYSIANGPSSQASLFYKFATSTNESDPTITHTGGSSIVANCAIFRGVDTSNPFDGSDAAASSTADSTVETGRLTTAAPNTVLLFAGHMADDHSAMRVTDGGGLSWISSFFNAATEGSGQAISLYYAPKSATGSIGPIVGTVTYSASSVAAVSSGILLALRSKVNSLSINVPTGTVSGDVMIASIAVTPGTVSISTPTGWTLIRGIQNASSSTSRLAVFQRVANADEPSSYSWALGRNHTGVVGGIASFSGVDNTHPINKENAKTTPSSTTHATPSITPTSTNVMLIGTFSYASAGTWTPPANMTEAVDVASRTTNSSSGESMEMTYQTQASMATTGVKSAVATASRDRGITHVLALQPTTSSTVADIDHIQIEHDGSGVICSSEPIVIKACANAACTSLYTGSTTVTLLPAAATNISWDTNPLTFSGSASVHLSVTSVQSVALGTSTVSPIPANSSSCNVNALLNCNLPFASSGFLFSSIPSQTAGTASAAITLQAITGSSGSTCTGLSTGNKTIELAFQCDDPGSCAGQQVSINSTAIAGNLSSGVSSYTSVLLTFDTLSKTSFTINYPDVGKINLAARYALGGGSYMQGNSNVFVVKPYGFAFTNIKRMVDNFANPAASNATGGVFVKAGNPFSATVSAINSSGAITPNFGKESSPEGVILNNNLVAPDPAAGGNIGTLDGTLAVTGDLFSNGSAQLDDLTWDDVGIISFTANILDKDYMGAGNVSSTSANIGRFTPDHFSTAVAPACSSATPFTYSGQHADITVSALDANEDVTANYDFTAGFAKTITLSDAGSTTGFSLNTLTVDMTAGIGTDADVVYTFASKSTPPTTLAIRAIDTDAISSQGFTEDTELVYSGRLSLQNAQGSELLDLSMPLEAQYWMGSYYVKNTDDSCSQLPVPTVGNGLTFGGNLTAAMTALSLNGVSSGMSSLLQGLGNLIWTKPGANNTGYVDIVITSPDWLKFNWNGTGDTNPTARATFGIYKGNPKIIYMREVY